MPVYESCCFDPACGQHGKIVERLSRYDDPEPMCVCGVPTKRLISNVNVIWTGTLDRFKQKRDGFNDGMERQSFQECDGGHFAFRTKTSRLLDGGPEKVLIRTRQEQKEFCRDEGLTMPDDINPNSYISDDGKTLYTTGMPGQWELGRPVVEQAEPKIHTEAMPGAWEANG